MVPQSLNLFRGQLKHEIFWETIDVPFNGSVESFSFHLIQFGQVDIEHDLATADHEDAICYGVDRNVLLYFLCHARFISSSHPKRVSGLAASANAARYPAPSGMTASLKS